MKIFRNRIFIGLICIALALAIIFLAAPAVVNDQIKTTEVVTAASNIEAGTVIFNEMLQTVRMPVSIVPSDAMNQAASIGKYTASTIWAGDIITAAKITATNTQEAAMILTYGALKRRMKSISLICFLENMVFLIKSIFKIRS